MKVNILEAKNRLSQLIHSALAGEEVIIANRGNPVVKLVPIEKNDANEEVANPISGQGLSEWLKENPLPQHLRRSHTNIDNSIQSERDSWN